MHRAAEYFHNKSENILFAEEGKHIGSSDGMKPSSSPPFMVKYEGKCSFRA
jgi:hypothetical protein